MKSILKFLIGVAATLIVMSIFVALYLVLVVSYILLVPTSIIWYSLLRGYQIGKKKFWEEIDEIY